MAENTGDDRVPVTISLDRETVAMIEDILKPPRTLEDTLEEMVIGTVPTWHFLEKEAPADYYTVSKAVTKEEIAAFREGEAARMVQKALLRGHRKEAVAFGLLAAAHELCVRIAQDAGYEHPDQHADHMAMEMLQGVSGGGPLE